jgi:hypothetical protein
MSEQTVAQRIRERNRKILQLPSSGEEVVIRKLMPVDFLAATQAIPAQTTERVSKGKKSKKVLEASAAAVDKEIAAHPEKFRRFYEAALVGGMESPRVVPHGTEPDPGKNEIGPYDLGPDTDFVVGSIFNFTRGQDAEGAGGEAAPFREGGDKGKAEGTDTD